MSARARVERHFTTAILCNNLGIDADETEGGDNNEGGSPAVEDERVVPLLADMDAEVQTTPPMVDSENVIVVEAKEVPADVPEASEVV